jgi:hypothetical protein
MKVLSLVALTSLTLWSCSIFKDNRYPTYEESIQKFFQTNYHEMDFEKYEGLLEFEFGTNDTIIKLDSLEIAFSSENSDYLELFKNRLIPSDVLYTDTLKKVSVCCFEQFEYLKTKKTARRFKLWKYDGRFVNPTAFYFELTNNNSDKETDLKTFIEGAKLTFMSRPLLQI